MNRASRQLPTGLTGLIGGLLLVAACAPAPSIGVGRQALTGKDGAKTVAGTETVNLYTPLTVAAAPNDTKVTVADTTGFSVGDLVLLVASQGASIGTGNTSTTYGNITDLGPAGLNELWVLSAVNTGTGELTLDLGCGLTGLSAAYPLAAKPQVVRVPQYTTLSVPMGTLLTGLPWDGARGGYVVVHVEGAASVDGMISASGLGFRGGAVSLGTSTVTSDELDFVNTSAIGGEKGESVVGNIAAYDALGGRYGRGSPANGGGGGNGYLAGGGGGAGADAVNGNAFSGQGTMSPSVTGGSAWTLDPGNATSGGPGGGRGGYSLSALDQNALAVGPGIAAWGGNGRLERGGLGGHAVTNASRLILGGGGGAGHFDDVALPTSTVGAAGGGVVYLMANTLAGGGTIVADGKDGRAGTITGTNDLVTVANGGGAGGGGGGGMVLLRANGSPSLATSARGGAGGGVTVTGVFSPGMSGAGGPGGGGAGGAVGTFTGLLLTTPPTVTAGLGGTTNAPALTEFPSNGASSGDAGVSSSGIPQASPPKACLPADVSITLDDSADPVDINDTYSYLVGVANAGPNAAFDLSAMITLPPGVTAGVITATGWSCNQVAQVVTCTRAILRASQTAPISIAVTAPGTASTVNASATITSREDPAAGNNSSGESTVIQVPKADLSLLQTAPSATASGESFTYSFAVTNNGPRTAPSVKLVDTLPAGVTFVSASGAGWSCTPSGSTVTCTQGSLASGGSSSVDLLVSAPALTSAVTLNNSGTVSINSSGTVDPAAGNDTSAANTTITPVNLSITKVDTADPVPASGSITYMLTVTNPAAVVAHALVVNDTLPSGTAFVSASGSGWSCALGGSTIECTLPSIPASSTSSITVVLTAPGTQGVIANTATVSALATDPSLADNTATEQTTISPPAPGSADLSVSLTDSPDPVEIGTPLTLTINASNAGPDPANGVQVLSTLPLGATFISAVGSGWTCSQAGTTITCQRSGALAVGAAPSIFVSLTAPTSPSTPSSTVVVTAATPDPAVGNNSATTTTSVIDPTAFNKPPALTLPSMLSTLEDTTLVFAGATAPTVADPDAGAAMVELRVTGTSCVLTLASTSGLDLVVGDGILDPTLVARGTLADLNLALDGASATPIPDFSGTASLAFTIDDLGNTGANGPMQANGTLSFAVLNVDDPPIARDDEMTVSVGATRIDVLANDSSGDADQVLTLVSTTQPANGVVQIVVGAVEYTPNAGYVGDDGFDYVISDGHTQATASVVVHVKGIDVPIEGVTIGGGGIGCGMTPAHAGSTNVALGIVALALALLLRRRRVSESR